MLTSNRTGTCAQRWPRERVYVRVPARAYMHHDGAATCSLPLGTHQIRSCLFSSMNDLNNLSISQELPWISDESRN